MKQRILGGKLPVSEVGLGCMGMSEFYGKSDERTSIATIRRAIDLGISMFDTSDMYGPYTNEELLGKAIAGRRSNLIIATKFGYVRDVKDPGKREVTGRPGHVKKACDESLKRLGVDTIDLYYQHRVDPQTPIEETVGAMADLVRAGKVRFLGLSEAGLGTIRRAHRTHPIAAIETEYSLWSREPEDGLLALCRELGIGFVAYSPLGRGFLAGYIESLEDLELDDYRRKTPRFQGDNLTKNRLLVQDLRKVALRRGVTTAQLALAWLLAQGTDIVPIPGSRRIDHLEENVHATAIDLSFEEKRNIEQIFSKGSTHGSRYPEETMRRLNL